MPFWLLDMYSVNFFEKKKKTNKDMYSKSLKFCLVSIAYNQYYNDI